jgi:spore maturation protein CgeB
VNSGAEVLLATGIAPILAEHISALRSRGIQVLNFLTDDPWNPAHSAGWFFNALREYDVVFTPREANIGDLRKHGCRAVEYLPFAYPEEWIQPVQPVLPVAEDADIIFAGGADRDRVTWITPLISAGLRVELYGGYWGRYPGTRKCARGFITPRELCSAVARSKIALCLVRRANRDGHSMRSYELPAMKACMLVEHTSEHERMFGAEGQSVLYFRSPDEMVGKAKWLIERPEVRKRLREAVYALITQGTNTYTDRLRQILSPVMSAP